jgi:hypothetical protein
VLCNYFFDCYLFQVSVGSFLLNDLHETMLKIHVLSQVSGLRNMRRNRVTEDVPLETPSKRGDMRPVRTRGSPDDQQQQQKAPAASDSKRSFSADLSSMGRLFIKKARERGSRKRKAAAKGKKLEERIDEINEGKQEGSLKLPPYSGAIEADLSDVDSDEDYFEDDPVLDGRNGINNGGMLPDSLSDADPIPGPTEPKGTDGVLINEKGDLKLCHIDAVVMSKVFGHDLGSSTSLSSTSHPSDVRHPRKLHLRHIKAHHEPKPQTSMRLPDRWLRSNVTTIPARDEIEAVTTLRQYVTSLWGISNNHHYRRPMVDSGAAEPFKAPNDPDCLNSDETQKCPPVEARIHSLTCGRPKWMDTDTEVVWSAALVDANNLGEGSAAVAAGSAGSEEQPATAADGFATPSSRPVFPTPVMTSSSRRGSAGHVRRPSGIEAMPSQGIDPADAIKAQLTAEINLLWQRAVTMIRPLIPQLFHNPALSLDFLPDMLHLILTCVGSGPLRARSGLYLLTCNFVQALVICKVNNMGSVLASLDTLNKVLNTVNGAHFRYIFCDAPSLTVAHAEAIVFCFCSILQPEGSSNRKVLHIWRSTWANYAMYSLTALIPAASSSRYALLLGALCDNVSVPISYALSAIISSIGVALESSDGSASDDVLLESLQKCMWRFCDKLSMKQLISLFWVALMLLQRSSGATESASFELVLRITQALIQKKKTSHESNKEPRNISLLEEDLLFVFAYDSTSAASAVDGEIAPEIDVDDLLAGFFDILEEASLPEILGLPLTNVRQFSFSLTALLLRSFISASLKHRCIELLEMLDLFYIQSGGLSRLGISGYATALLCVAGHSRSKLSEGGGVISETTSTNGPFGFSNFPRVDVAIHFLTVLLSIIRYDDSSNVQMRAHQVLQSLIKSMPVLSICLHEILFPELTREYYRHITDDTPLNSLITASIDACLYHVLLSHPIGYHLSLSIPSELRNKKFLKAFSSLPEDRGYDERVSIISAPENDAPQEEPDEFLGETTALGEGDRTDAFADYVSASTQFIAENEAFSYLEAGVFKLYSQMALSEPFPVRT